MNVFVTGATGYVGSWLCRSLYAAGHTVSYLYLIADGDLPSYPENAQGYSYSGDGSGLISILRDANPDLVIHLAGVVSRAPADVLRMVEANLTFGIMLCEAMTAVGCRALINVGSYWQYGPNGEYCPNSLYAATKQAFQDVISFYACAHGLRALTLIFFDVFGPRDPRPKLIPEVIAAVKSGRDFDATSGEQIICPIYIKDACAAFQPACMLVTSAGFQGHQIYAVDTSLRVSVRQLVEELLGTVAARVTVNWGAKPHRPDQIAMPVSRLPLLPGWAPCFALPAALSDLALEEGIS